jgi:hypothetical protein
MRKSLLSRLTTMPDVYRSTYPGKSSIGLSLTIHSVLPSGKSISSALNIFTDLSFSEYLVKYKVLKSLLNAVASAGKGEIEFRGKQPGIPWYRIFHFGITDKHLAERNMISYHPAGGPGGRQEYYSIPVDLDP